MYRDLDLVDGTGIPDFEFLWFLTLLLTMMMVEMRVTIGEAKVKMREVNRGKCSARAGYTKHRRFLRTLRMNSGIARNQTLKSC